MSGGPRHVFDDVGNASAQQPVAYGANEIRMRLCVVVAVREPAVSLARWRRPDRVVAFKRKRQCIGLMKLVPDVTRLRSDVDTDHIKPGLLEPSCRSASPAEEIAVSIPTRQWFSRQPVSPPATGPSGSSSG